MVKWNKIELVQKDRPQSSSKPPTFMTLTTVIEMPHMNRLLNPMCLDKLWPLILIITPQGRYCSYPILESRNLSQREFKWLVSTHMYSKCSVVYLNSEGWGVCISKHIKNVLYFYGSLLKSEKLLDAPLPLSLFSLLLAVALNKNINTLCWQKGYLEWLQDNEP